MKIGILTSGSSECPGKGLGVELSFTTMANILTVFDICKARDTDGNEVSVEAKFSSGGIKYVSQLPSRYDRYTDGSIYL